MKAKAQVGNLSHCRKTNRFDVRPGGWRVNNERMVSTVLDSRVIIYLPPANCWRVSRNLKYVMYVRLAGYTWLPCLCTIDDQHRLEAGPSRLLTDGVLEPRTRIRSENQRPDGPRQVRFHRVSSPASVLSHRFRSESSSQAERERECSWRRWNELIGVSSKGDRWWGVACA